MTEKPKTRLPSLREMARFGMTTQNLLEDLVAFHPYIKVSWDCSTHSGLNQKAEFLLNWELDNKVFRFQSWDMLKAHVERRLDERSKAKR